MDRWSGFTDKEIYMLKRSLMESSFEIHMMKDYSKEQRKMHEDLLNELGGEDSRRLYA